MTKRRTRAHIAAALGTTAIIVLAGCSAIPGESDPDATTGGNLTFALAQSPGCLDAQQIAYIDALYVMRQVTETLTDQDPFTGEIRPYLAESWEINDDATEFTFHLREGVTFSDGTFFDAEVVAANMQAIFELGVGTRGWSYMSTFDGAEVVDDDTVIISFTEPNAPFLSGSSLVNLGFASLATLELTPEERCQGTVVGTGPFVLDSYIPDSEVVLVKREGYDWPSEVATHSGEALLDSITFQIVPESSVRIGSLTSGQVDGVMSVQPQDEEIIQSSGGEVLAALNPGIPMHFDVDVAQPVVSEEAVRLAVQVGIDRQEIADTVLSSHFTPATSMLTPNVAGYVDMSSELAYDPDTAAELLDDAGWELGDDGVREKDGQRLTLRLAYAPTNSFNRPAMELIQQQLARIGFEVTLKEFLATDFTTNREERDWDMTLGNSTDTDPNVFVNPFLSTANNVHRLPDPSVLDGLLVAQRGTADVTERADVIGGIQEYLIGNGYSIPVYDLYQILAFSEQVSGVEFDQTARPVFYGTSLTAVD